MKEFINFFNKKQILNILYAVCFSIGFNYYFIMNTSLKLILIVLFGLSIVILQKNVDKKVQRNARIFSFILSLALFIGKVVYNTNEINDLFDIKEFALTAISIFGFTVVIGKFVAIIYGFCIKIDESKKENKKWWIFDSRFILLYIWITVFLSWLIAFLAYAPGIFSYDSGSQVYQAINGFSEYTKFHPPLHTMLLQFCMFLEEKMQINYMSIYSIVQILILSFALSKMISYMIKKNVNNWIILISLLFITINPVISVFSMIMTKDVIFAAFMILILIEFMELLSNPEAYLKKYIKIIYFITICVLGCLFRNNAIYVLMALTLFVCIVLKKYLKRVVPLFIVSILLYFIINNVVYSFLGIKEGDNKEMLSVPIQQIANVVSKNEKSISEELKNDINTYLPYDEIANRYNFRFTDPVKDVFNTKKFDENPAKFIKLCFELFKTYPKDCISAFLTLNIPYWYPGSSTIDIYSQRRYIETSIMAEFPKEGSLLKLQKFYEGVADFETLEKNPFTAVVFSITFPIWILLFVEFLMCAKGNKKGAVALFPLILLWLTYMLGPVSNFRYIFPIFVSYPILLMLIFDSRKIFKEEDQ